MGGGLAEAGLKKIQPPLLLNFILSLYEGNSVSVLNILYRVDKTSLNCSLAGIDPTHINHGHTWNPQITLKLMYLVSE